MRIITLLIITTALAASVFSQPPVKKAASSNRTVPSTEQMPSKSEMQSQMNEATNEIKKQIADLEKQIKASDDPETVKSLKEEVSMLQKQLSMIHGVSKSLSGMSDKVIQQAVEEESVIVPKKDVTRINMLPKKILTDAELLLFTKNVHAAVEKIIPAIERTEALNIYNETKAKYKSTAVVANAASGCWMLGHWEKALFIMGKACMDDITDADNLNNYAAFLIMTGAEQAALPILEYSNEKYPNNSTILNNIGQAWFGLGDMEKANKYLNAATELYPNHSMANNTLSKVYQSQGDATKAVAFLKASLKENYDPEKEAELSRLGYAIKYSDMPGFNYPMKSDPLGIIPFVESLPENYPSKIGDDEIVNAVNGYISGIKNVANEQIDEDVLLQKKAEELAIRLSKDQQFRKEYLEPHNCPAWKLAMRSFQLIKSERFGTSSPLITQLWLPIQKPSGDQTTVKTVRETWLECQDIWTENVTKPLADLARAWQASKQGASCGDIDAATNEYLAKKAQIRKKGMQLIKAKVHESAHGIDNWIKIVLYAAQGVNNPNKPKNDDELTMDLISQLDVTTERKAYRNGELNYILNMAQNFLERQTSLKSACDLSANPTSGDPDLTPLVPIPNPYKIKVKCEFKKVMTTPVVVYKFECNALKEATKGNMKSKKEPVNKGQGQSSSRRNSNKNGPLRGGRGPSADYESEEFQNVAQNFPPLTAENKDLSQFSIEYDKWGNLVGLNLQLNEEGTSLADPDSAESGIDSRWSWNAIASPKKGFLNKLIIK